MIRSKSTVDATFVPFFRERDGCGRLIGKKSLIPLEKHFSTGFTKYPKNTKPYRAK